MLYSCAVYPSKDASLEDAQQYKLKRICEQVELQPGDSVIEIGTGMGRICHLRSNTLRLPRDDYHNI